MHVTHVVEEASEPEAWMGQRSPGLQEAGCVGAGLTGEREWDPEH